MTLCMVDKDEFWEDYQYSTEADCLRDYMQNKQRREKWGGMEMYQFPDDRSAGWDTKKKENEELDALNLH